MKLFYGEVLLGTAVAVQVFPTVKYGAFGKKPEWKGRGTGTDLESGVLNAKITAVNWKYGAV